VAGFVGRQLTVSLVTHLVRVGGRLAGSLEGGLLRVHDEVGHVLGAQLAVLAQSRAPVRCRARYSTQFLHEGVSLGETDHDDGGDEDAQDNGEGHQPTQSVSPVGKAFHSLVVDP